MTRNDTELTYLRAAVQSASAVGLVIVLYDLLISDLRAAIAAMADNNIEQRSRELKHAFLVLEQMEQSLDTENGGQAAVNLSRFYATLRRNIMEAHAKANPQLFSKQIELIFQVRGAWAQVDKPAAEELNSANSYSNRASASVESEESRPDMAASWSA